MDLDANFRKESLKTQIDLGWSSSKLSKLKLIVVFFNFFVGTGGYCLGKMNILLGKLEKTTGTEMFVSFIQILDIATACIGLYLRIIYIYIHT